MAMSPLKAFAYVLTTALLAVSGIYLALHLPPAQWLAFLTCLISFTVLAAMTDS